MAKNTSLTSDVDFIKEFEELKLKQKLLIDSLNKKNISQQNELFLEINSKLDFLVKIFKDANDNDSKAEEEKLESHFKLISDKMDLIQKDTNDRLDKLENNTSLVSSELKQIKEKLNEKKSEESLNSPNNSIPLPKFEVKTTNSNTISTPVSSQVLLTNVEEKKKGWFK